LREFDRLGEDLKVIERDLARSALADDVVKRLTTIPGVDMVVALAIVSGDRRRGTLRAVAEVVELPRPQPAHEAVRPQTGLSRGRITKQGRGHARGMLVEPEWAVRRPNAGHPACRRHT
jgi:hypothetical protein